VPQGSVRIFRKYKTDNNTPDKQGVRQRRVWAKESGSFVAGKSEFHGRKVGETRHGLWKEGHSDGDVKVFHKIT
jgi:hypothetical protein